jgi:phosphatidylinositol-3-phosphatase
MNRFLYRHASEYRLKAFLTVLTATFSMAAIAGCGAPSPDFGMGNSAPSKTAKSQENAAAVADASRSAAVTVVPRSAHLIVVMEENTGYASVVKNTAAWPNLNRLIATGALPTNYYANSHPSIGNYFMLTTGQLLTVDDNSNLVWAVDSIARRMLQNGVPFRVYAEDAPRGYLGGNTATYLVRHNPFARLSDVADNASVANAVLWPFTQFYTDLHNNNLPELSFIIPNIYHDAHNGSPQVADSWLQAYVVNQISAFPEFKAGGDGILVVAFDEAADTDTTWGGGHVSPVFWGPSVRAAYTQQSTTVYQHQSMLRTFTEALGLANPPGDAASAPSMAEFFNAAPAAGVTVTQPSAGATVISPVHYVASASTNTCAKGVAAMGIYVNNALTYVVNGAQLNTTLALKPGPEHTVVEEWDYCGGASFTTINLTVQ